MNIEGASAIVTGGASGLGAATARALSQRGARVVILDRQEDGGRKVAAELGGIFAPADVSDEEQVQGAVDAAVDLGPLRVLVNCAGLGPPGRIVDREGTPIPLNKFDFVVRVNLIGSYNCARLAAAAMTRSEPLEDGARGVILHTASVAAFDGQIGQTPYSAAKGGVVAMTLPMARDLALHGIRVNTIAPGLIDTPIYGAGEKADAFKSKLGTSVVFPQRLGYADEFASLAVELVTNSYMNGEVVRLDGAIRLPPR
ncbi:MULTISPECIES: SDR family NAD(P)-dependent oxidoreductase [unclassified Mycobacterium]|uniref:SDR family NAD(P)-dependent oxidoreductase n=1 Tax=unclassified Mycobacterium TaxID=2642494 RepID=UPI00073FD323|nr:MULTISPECIES: SDR family NAD(P)-dependent oxidoreductase [unclassified Mycobacterium]KUH83124.1 3-hydroxy-2-methylbutyryl-CoA dehydrogenase [Mycobacterium sp. GA-0227b]KUH84466.1 3-hydroxy-2-methylbutyryl-CoA dehydrogenase [Mycobacterium sp. GA-1999]KUH89398.1 3-hydroxy-2-methylbutyryl-CoA dehydrogenase [Mycobacterium sp. IS-1556]